MFRFKLNEQLKKYIREVRIEHNKTDVIRDYLRELEYECDITISIGESEFKFNGFTVLPDWESQCFRIDKKNRDNTFNHMNEIFDLKNTFKIPFTTVQGGHVKFVTTWYGNMDITNKFIELIENAYSDELYGYRYEFIKESFDNSYAYVYMINHEFYNVYISSPNKYCTEYQLNLTECRTGQSHFVTALELLRGAYSYTSELEKTEDGLLIPNLTIEKYKKI